MKKPEEEIIEHSDFVYGSANRILHWIRALVITGLIITGFYIADPFLSSDGSTDKLLYAEWTQWHLIMGFILIASGLLRIYLFFFGRDSASELRSLKDVFNVKSWIVQLKSYFFIGELRKKGIYGPLQFLTYTAIMLLLIVVSVTGLVLYVHVYHAGLGGWLYEPMRVVEALMGHEGYLTEVYRRYTLEDLRKFYLKGEFALLVFTEAQEVTKLRKEVEERNSKLQNNFIEISTKNLTLENKLARMEKENRETKKEMRELSLTVRALVKKLEELTES